MRKRFGSAVVAPSFPVASPVAAAPVASAPVVSAAVSELELGEVSGAGEAWGSSVSSEGLRSLTDYWFTEVTSPGSPLANPSVSTGEYVPQPRARSAVSSPLAATSEHDLRPLDDESAELEIGDTLVDVLAESALAIEL